MYIEIRQRWLINKRALDELTHRMGPKYRNEQSQRALKQ